MINRRSDELELFNERAGIREFDGGLSRDIAERLAEEDVEAYRHKCEIDSIVRMYKTKGGDAVKSFLLQVENTEEVKQPLDYEKKHWHKYDWEKLNSKDEWN